MTAGSWTDADLRRVRPDTTMWVVRVGADLYVRSAGGPHRPWYRHALTSGVGRIRAGGIDSDVTGPPAHPVSIRLVKTGPDRSPS